MTLSEAQKQARYNYAKKSLKRIPLDVQKEKYEQIKQAATAAGESVNGYIKKAVDNRMERESIPGIVPDPEEPRVEEKPVAAEPVKQNQTQKKYAPFTEADASKINLQDLKKDIIYQLKIEEDYGHEVLVELLERANQEGSPEPVKNPFYRQIPER